MGDFPTNSRIYIGGISPDVSKQDIIDLFSQFGKIYDTRTARKFAFVQFETEEVAKKAIDEIKGTFHWGQKLNVQFAKATVKRNAANLSDDKTDIPREDSTNDNRPNRDKSISPWESNPPQDNNNREAGRRSGNFGNRSGNSNERDRSNDRCDRGGSSDRGSSRGDRSNDRDRGGGRGGRGGPNDRSGVGSCDRGGGSDRGTSSDRGGAASFFQSNRDSLGPSPWENNRNFGGSGNFGGGQGGNFGGRSGNFGGSGGNFGSGSGNFGSNFGDNRGTFRSDNNGPFPGRMSDRIPPPNLKKDFGEENERPPTHPQKSMSTSHVDRTNDIEIIVVNRALMDYGEFIEKKLKGLGFSVDLLFPNEEVPLGRVLGNIASRGSLYAILVTTIHRQNSSFTLFTLYGQAQEHRNMLVEDGITFLSRNYDQYIKDMNSKKDKNEVPDDIRILLERLLSRDIRLTAPQFEKIMEYCLEEKKKLDPPMVLGKSRDGPGPSLQETTLQNRILDILNKSGGSVGAISTNSPNINQQAPQPVAPPTTTNLGQNMSNLMGSGGGSNVVSQTNVNSSQQPQPLLKDPSVQKALDSLMQGDLLRKIQSTQSYNRF